MTPFPHAADTAEDVRCGVVDLPGPAAAPAAVPPPLHAPARKPQRRESPLDDGTPWTLVVHLDAGHATAGLLKVLSVLHSRRVVVFHLQYVQAPDGSAVMTVECSPGVAPLETVRKSVANAIPVVSVRVHPAAPRDGVSHRRVPRTTHG